MADETSGSDAAKTAEHAIGQTDPDDTATGTGSAPGSPGTGSAPAQTQDQAVGGSDGADQAAGDPATAAGADAPAGPAGGDAGADAHATDLPGSGEPGGADATDDAGTDLSPQEQRIRATTSEKLDGVQESIDAAKESAVQALPDRELPDRNT